MLFVLLSAVCNVCAARRTLTIGGSRLYSAGMLCCQLPLTWCGSDSISSLINLFTFRCISVVMSAETSSRKIGQ